MNVFFCFAQRNPFRTNWLCSYLVLVLAAAGLLSGCISKVQIPAVEQFRVAVGNLEGSIDADANGQILLNNLYELMKANEGLEVPLCTASRDSKQCIKDGVGVFVWGGCIPGIGTRKCYVFSDISLREHQLEFFKDNRKTRFIGTPMLTRGNKCRVYVEDGGLKVQMTRYYANWAGVGNMTMAEGWAIDFLDLNNGIVGLQLELDIKGAFVAGGGSRYVLLKFSNIPETIDREEIQFKISNGQ